jgi:glucan phosphorylase
LIPRAIVVGFFRRLATYKRTNLIARGAQWFTALITDQILLALLISQTVGPR